MCANLYDSTRYLVDAPGTQPVLTEHPTMCQALCQVSRDRAGSHPLGASGMATSLALDDSITVNSLADVR